MINRIRTSPQNLTESLGRKKETVNHLGFNYKLYEEEREYMFRKVEKKKKKFIIDIDRMIKDREREILFIF